MICGNVNASLEVVGLELSNNSLSGDFAGAVSLFGALRCLRSLNLSANALTGTFPHLDAMGLVSVQILVLENNFLHGSLPPLTFMTVCAF